MALHVCLQALHAQQFKTCSELCLNPVRGLLGNPTYHAERCHVYYLLSIAPNTLLKHQFCADIACRAPMAELAGYQATIEATSQVAGCVIRWHQ